MLKLVAVLALLAACGHDLEPRPDAGGPDAGVADALSASDAPPVDAGRCLPPELDAGARCPEAPAGCSFCVACHTNWCGETVNVCGGVCPDAGD